MQTTKDRVLKIEKTYSKERIRSFSKHISSISDQDLFRLSNLLDTEKEKRGLLGRTEIEAGKRMYVALRDRGNTKRRAINAVIKGAKTHGFVLNENDIVT